MPTKTLVIALDAVDFECCRLAQQAGAAPFLKSLSKRLATRSVHFEPCTSDDAVWATFQYGLKIGDHGRYFWKREDRSAKDGFQYVDMGEDHLRPFWTEEPFIDQNIAIFDMPKMRVVKPTRGIHLANWLVHGRYGLEGATSAPPEVARHVRNTFGEPPPSICDAHETALSEAQIEGSVVHLLRSIDMKASAALHYLENDSWDCFMTSFKELHCASHALWDRLPKKSEQMESTPFFRLFQSTDIAVKALVEKAGQDCHLCLFSTTGMAGNSSVSHLAEGLLHQAGKRITSGWRQKLRGSPFRLVPYNENNLAVRIAPRWRSRQQYLLEALTEFLSQVTAGPNGPPIFDPPVNSKEAWHGSARNHLPHLIFPLKHGLGCPTALYFEAQEVVRGEKRPLRQGNHYGDGFCYLSSGFEESLPPGKVRLEDLGRAALNLEKA